MPVDSEPARNTVTGAQQINSKVLDENMANVEVSLQKNSKMPGKEINRDFDTENMSPSPLKPSHVGKMLNKENQMFKPSKQTGKGKSGPELECPLQIMHKDSDSENFSDSGMSSEGRAEKELRVSVSSGALEETTDNKPRKSRKINFTESVVSKAPQAIQATYSMIDNETQMGRTEVKEFGMQTEKEIKNEAQDENISQRFSKIQEENARLIEENERLKKEKE